MLVTLAVLGSSTVAGGTGQCLKRGETCSCRDGAVVSCNRCRLRLARGLPVSDSHLPESLRPRLPRTFTVWIGPALFMDAVHAMVAGGSNVSVMCGGGSVASRDAD